MKAVLKVVNLGRVRQMNRRGAPDLMFVPAANAVTEWAISPASPSAYPRPSMASFDMERWAAKNVRVSNVTLVVKVAAIGVKAPVPRGRVPSDSTPAVSFGFVATQTVRVAPALEPSAEELAVGPPRTVSRSFATNPVLLREWMPADIAKIEPVLWARAGPDVEVRMCDFTTEIEYEPYPGFPAGITISKAADLDVEPAIFLAAATAGKDGKINPIVTRGYPAELIRKASAMRDAGELLLQTWEGQPKTSRHVRVVDVKVGEAPERTSGWYAVEITVEPLPLEANHAT